MARAVKPLTLVVDDGLVGFPGLVALAEKGHTIKRMSEFTDATGFTLAQADRVLGARAWRLLPQMLGFLPEIIKHARAVKYGSAEEATD